MHGTCPNADTLCALLEGRLEDPHYEVLMGHLAACPVCQRRASSVPANGWLGNAANARSDWIPANERPVVEELLRRAASVYTQLYAEPSSMLNLPVGEIVTELRGRFGDANRPEEVGRIGPYRLLSVLGIGGMGVVLRAADERLHRPVALKLLRPDMLGRSDFRQRFLREARAMASVVHDHVVPVYEVGEAGGLPYLVMPLLVGTSLSTWIRTHAPAPVDTAIRWAKQIAEGLAAAHARGLIHRDIKPGNLWLEMLTPEGATRIRILDFGLVLSEQESRTRTLQGVVLGTPEYLAPEQGRGETADGRTDLFALGCVLYELLTGVSPFRRPTLLASLSALANEEPRDIRTLNPKVPATLAGLIKELLNKQREGRPTSAGEVIHRLEAVEQGTPQLTREQLTRWVVLASVVVLPFLVLPLLALCVGLGYQFLSGKPGQAPSKPPRVSSPARPTPPEGDRGNKQPPAVAPQQVRAHTGAVTALLFLRGDTLLSGSRDGTVRRWSLPGWKEQDKPITLPQHCVGLSRSQDGATLAIASADGTIQVREIDSRKLVCTLRDQKVHDVTFGHTTDTLFTATDRGIVWWSIRNREHRSFVFQSFRVNWVKCGPEGKNLVTSTPRGTQLMVMALANNPARGWSHVWAHKGPIRAGAFSPDGQFLATVSGAPDARVRLWDMTTRKPLADSLCPPQHRGGAMAVDWAKTNLIASVGVDGVLQLWDPKTRKMCGSIQANRPDQGGLTITCLAFSPDSLQLAAGKSDGTIGVWEVARIVNPAHR